MRRKASSPPLIPCPWHEGWHNSRFAVRICKQYQEPSVRCSACRSRLRRQSAVDPRCEFHRKHPDLEQGDWLTAHQRDLESMGLGPVSE